MSFHLRLRSPSDRLLLISAVALVIAGIYLLVEAREALYRLLGVVQVFGGLFLVITLVRRTY
jgi:hypothetical protein